MPKPLPSISFIIPTLNAQEPLVSCLESIRSQAYPQEKVEIIVADAGSTDDTRAIASRYGARIIDNPERLHEPGKSRAAKLANGELLFFTDADNVLASKDWLRNMIRPYQEVEGVAGLLPQTTAPPDSSGLNRYLGYLFTDPLTWFIYGPAANPATYEASYRPVINKKHYRIYRFTAKHHPLFGLSQGVGVSARFQRDGIGRADDILAGIKLIQEGHKIAYVPAAPIYHYHVRHLGDFIRKYRWRIRHNLNQQVKGMGLVNRLPYYSAERKRRLYLFVPYGLSLIFSLIDSLRLSWRWRDWVMLWHPLACFILALLIAIEYTKKRLGLPLFVGTYGK